MAQAAGPTQTFFRVVSPEEMADIRATGALRLGPNTVEGKHLTGSVEEAVRFGNKLYPGGTFHVVEITIDEAMAERFFPIGQLDLCGRGWFAEIDDLIGCTISEVTR
jgi:hypothetical protein